MLTTRLDLKDEAHTTEMTQLKVHTQLVAAV